MDIYDLELKLKSYLTTHRIRLCDSPYTDENSPGSGLKLLAESLSKELTHDALEIETVLNHLRLKAINNLKSHDKIQKEDICSIKIHQPKSLEDVTVEICDFSRSTGLVLKQEISKLFSMSDETMKIIFRGKLINDNDLLRNQGIKNSSKVMVLNISEKDHAIQDECSEFGKGKDMAEYLAKRAIDGRFASESMNVEITNQNGEVLYLTNDQKSLLTFGLAMHQKAITSISNNQYNIALLYCLEADEAFTKSQYSESIDNTAILQLDIVWCYYCIQNMDDLSNANKRLAICEQRMKKCYGEGNERIRRIREQRSFEGTPESVHIYRLYLLKAIVSYYENNIGDGRVYLFKALEVYKAFVIEEPLITEVMLLGFSRKQAISGLRFSKNINTCVEYILRRADDKRVRHENRIVDEKRAEVARWLGNTMNDSLIDVQVLDKLIDQSHMNPSLCLAAVRRSNNNFHDAMEMLFNDPDQLMADIDQQSKEGLVVDGNDISYESLLREKAAVRELKQLVPANKTLIQRLLRQAGGNVTEAMAALLATHIDENSNYINTLTQSSSSGSLSSSGSSSTSPMTTSIDLQQERAEKKEMERQIHETIGEGATQTLESQYVSPDLTNEILAFNKFAKLLSVPEIVNDNNEVMW